MLCSDALLTMTPPMGTGSKLATGVKRAGAADLRLTMSRIRVIGLARLEFVGDRPARRAGDLAEAALQLGVVDFDHQAVDLVGQLVAPASISSR